MFAMTVTVAMLFTQADPSAPAPAPVAAQAEADAGIVQAPPRNRAADDIAALVKKLSTMTDAERTIALTDLKKKYGDQPSLMPPPEVDLIKYVQLAPVDQARVSARHFFVSLVAGNINEVVAHSGFPFYLEDRRVERAEELKNDWAKSLRSKRTDLVTLYDIELLSPADMEKKYGKPPTRLGQWNWRTTNGFLAVANLSGHAAVVLLRPQGLAWQVVGYHD